MANKELDRVIAELRALDERKRFNRMEYFKPYPKQVEFFGESLGHRETMLLGGNQIGKTECGGFATTCHMTGRYPDWWPGKRFTEPTTGWICGETSVAVRDIQQAKLCGPPGVDDMFGTGLIPRELFVDRPSLSRGVTDAYDTIQVRHVSGGISTAQFKSYEQGRRKFQGTTKNWIWSDEEAPMDIYTEMLARITATQGIIYCTLTPLEGRTELVLHYLEEPSADRSYTMMSLYEAEHISPDDYQSIISGYPAHQREARIRGIPVLGQGRVFPYPQELISEAPLEYIPRHWFKLWGTDFGIGHPFGAVLVLWDKDNDVIHVHHTIRIKALPGMPGGLPINHAKAMKAIGAAVPVAWPHDGAQRDKGSGITVAAQYRKEGLLMLPKHATFIDGGYSTEAGVLEMDDRMQSGRLKVAAHLADWFQEYNNYHRKDGLIVKVDDDLLSATRIAIMDKRHARLVELGSATPDRSQTTMAKGIEFDLFGGGAEGGERNSGHRDNQGRPLYTTPTSEGFFHHRGYED